MTFKFEVELTGASQDEHDYQDEAGKSSGFIRSKQNNSLLQPMQIKDNFFDIVDENAVLWGDFDGIPFKCASSVEDDYIVVKLLKQEDITDKKLVFENNLEYKNKTDFKGTTKGDKIGSGSVLHDKNIEREIAGLEPYTMSDFEITPCKKLKHEKGATIDGIKFENSLEVCKYYIDKWVEACLLQTRLKKVRPVLGSGITHRHSVLVPHQYKSERNEVRPILLKEARQHLIDNYDTVIAPPLFEADEVVDAVAAKAYDHARVTGTKIRVVKAANDKDAKSKRGVLFDWEKSFHFNNPQCWLIKDFDEDVGLLEMHKGSIKGAGSKFFAYQILISDTADEYSPRKYLPSDFKHYGKGYGDESFYKDFSPLKTSEEVWQKVVDKYYEWFPKGLIYTAWDGTEVCEDTLSYLQKHFQLAYMLEGRDDKATVMDLLSKFNVDYSKIVGNNKPKLAPLVPDELLRSNLAEYSSTVESVMALLSDKSGKVADKLSRLEEALKMLGEVKNFDKLYEA